jgi:hypothetical protein
MNKKIQGRNRLDFERILRAISTDLVYTLLTNWKEHVGEKTLGAWLGRVHL